MGYWAKSFRIFKAVSLPSLLLLTGHVHALSAVTETPIHHAGGVTFQAGDTVGAVHIERTSDTSAVSRFLHSNVTDMNPGGVAPAPAEDVILTFQLTNTGSGEETFMLDTHSLQNDFTAEITAMWLESNGEPGLQNNDTLYQDGEGVPLQADQTVTVYVIGNIPPEEHESESGPLLTATITHQRDVGKAVIL